MLAVFAGFTELGGDGGGEGADALEHESEIDVSLFHERVVDGVAGGHEHGHRLADGAADAEQHGGEESVLGGRQQHFIGGLPARRPHRKRRFAVAVGHGLERVLADADHDGNAHQRQQERGVEHVQSDGHAKRPDDEFVHHCQADEAPDDARNRREQFDHDLQRLAHLALAEFRHEDGRAQPERHGDKHGRDRHAQGSQDEGSDAEAHVAHRGGIPVRVEDQLADTDLVRHGQRLAEDEEEDAEDEHDGADATEKM